MPADLAAFAEDAAAGPILSALAEGRWRKARDGAKDLCKKDKPRYLPLLIEANVGLAREMIGKGLTKDAESVIEYLKTLATRETIDQLRAELKSPAPKPAMPDEANVRGHAEAVSLWPAVVQAGGLIERGGTVTALDWAAIDTVVASFAPVPAGEAGSLAARIATELAAVRRACDASAEGRWEDAQEALRLLPRQSVFQHWRMLLRGLRHEFQGERDSAQRCFATLPEEGACARAAAAISGIKQLPHSRRRVSAAARAAWWLAASGQPASWAVPIAEADSLWRSGDWAKACQILTRGLDGRFPTDLPSLPGLLSDVLFPGHMLHSDLELQHANQELEFIRLLVQQPKKVPTTWKVSIRAMLMRDALIVPAQMLRKQWLEIMALDAQLHGPDRVRESLAWQWLGEQLAAEEPEAFPIFSRGVQLRDPKHAKEALQIAMERDPSNEAACLALLGLLEIQRNRSERNRLLDELVMRFPQNKLILLQAGVLAGERKAFSKAAGYLRAARALDPLDRQARHALVMVLIRQARELAKKKKDMSAVWAEIEPLLTDQRSSDDFVTQRWCMRVRQSLLGTDPEFVRQAAADAERLAPSDLERLAFEILLRSLYDLPSDRNPRQEWRAASSRTGRRWSDLEAVLAVLTALATMPEWSPREKSLSQFLLETLAAEIMRVPLDRDPEGILHYVEATTRVPQELWHLFSIAILDIQKQLEKALRPLAAPKKSDPRLRFAHLRLTLKATSPLGVSAPHLKQLEKTIADLEAAGHAQLAVDARRLQAILTAEPRFDGPAPLPAWQENEDYDYDYDHDDDAGQTNAPDLPPPAIFNLLQALLTGDQTAVEQAKQAARAAGFADATIRDVLNAVKRPKIPRTSHGKSDSQPEFDF